MPETIERDKMKVTINPDKDIVEEIRSAIKECEGHCPCALEWTPDTKCMCKKFQRPDRTRVLKVSVTADSIS